MTAPDRIARARRAPKQIPPIPLSDLGLEHVDEPLCDRCDASFRAPNDTLCEACRYEVDELYHDLPGASTAS